MEGFFKREISRMKAVQEYAEAAIHRMANESSTHGNESHGSSINSTPQGQAAPVAPMVNNVVNLATKSASLGNTNNPMENEEELYRKMEKEFLSEFDLDDHPHVMEPHVVRVKK